MGRHVVACVSHQCQSQGTPAVCSRCGHGGSRLAVASLVASHQEDMDQFDGAGEQWLLPAAHGCGVLSGGLPGLQAWYRVAQGVWHELHCRLYDGPVCELPQPQHILELRTGAVCGRLLSRPCSHFQQRDSLYRPVDDV